MRLFRPAFRVLLTAAALSVFGAGLFSCTPDYADQQSLTLLRYNGVSTAQGGAFPVAGGVVSASDILVTDTVTVLLSNESVSPNTGTLSLYDVILDGYTVSFERTDGGSAVPDAFGQELSQRIRVTNFGSSPSLVPVEILLLDPSQKLVPPLSDLTEFGFERATGFLDVQTNANVHIFGRNIMGDHVDVDFPIHVRFCGGCRPVT
jgi:hypothetical protein